MPDALDVIAGIDGGGTKTRVECYDARDFRLLGLGEAGPCNIAAMPVADALASVHSAFQRAGAGLASIRALCAAVAGYSHEARRLEFEAGLSALAPVARIVVSPDYEAAFRSALPGEVGVLVIAGTGSVAYARDADPAEHGSARSARAGGYGYLIDDAGSGYGVGRQALSLILAAQEGLGEPTTLGMYVAALLGWPEAAMERDAVVREVYFGELDRARIASLAEAVSEAAEAGDAVACRILMHAGGALARLAEAACRRVFGPAAVKPIPVARVGSLWRAGPALTSVFERSLARFAPTAEWTEPAEHTPAWGAARIALDLLRQPLR